MGYDLPYCTGTVQYVSILGKGANLSSWMRKEMAGDIPYSSTEFKSSTGLGTLTAS